MKKTNQTVYNQKLCVNTEGFITKMSLLIVENTD